jgi:hypothetical protein
VGILPPLLTGQTQEYARADQNHFEQKLGNPEAARRPGRGVFIVFQVRQMDFRHMNNIAEPPRAT